MQQVQEIIHNSYLMETSFVVNLPAQLAVIVVSLLALYVCRALTAKMVKYCTKVKQGVFCSCFPVELVNG